MKPLIYLNIRSLVNGFRRALSSPKRLIGVLFFVGYYILIFRPFGRGGALPSLPRDAQFPFPPVLLIDSVIFAVMGGITILMLVGISGIKSGFRAADVDVLFATPVSPKLVLTFRLLRDFGLTLILPLFILIFLRRPVSEGYGALFRGLPNTAAPGEVFRFGMLAYLLISVAFVTVSYAFALYINRPGESFERARRWFNWIGLFVLVSLVTGIGYLLSIQSPVDVAHTPWIRAVLFPATAATALATAPLTGNWIAGVAGGMTLVGIATAGYVLALRQHQWLYDLSAERVIQMSTMADLQKQGDYYGIVAHHARRGKVKAGRQNFIHRLRWTGPLALVWRDLLVMIRGRQMLYFLVGTMVFLTAMVLLIPDRSSRALPILMPLLVGQIAITSTMAYSQSGFIEMLRRVDFSKPLPFAPQTIVFAEVLAKSITGVLMTVAASLVGLVAMARSWQVWVAMIFGVSSLVILLSATNFLTTVLTPDIDDPTQRGFRGLMMMLGLIIFVLPAVGVFFGLRFFGVPIALTGVVVAIVNILLALAVCGISGRLYAEHNPSE